MFAIARSLVGLCLLLLLVQPTPMEAQGVSFATNFPPQLSFTETYGEKIVTEIDDGLLVYWDVPDDSSKFTTSGKVSAQGIDFSTLDPTSLFRFNLGELRLSGTLGDDPAYVPGATSARIPLIAYDYDTDTDVVAGYLILSWIASEITFSADVAAPETYSIVLDYYIDENEVFDDNIPFEFTFAGHTLNRTVYYRGKATTKTKEVGQGESADELDISTMNATGALDSTGPNLDITAPAEGAQVGTARIALTGTATDLHGVAEVAVQVNGGEYVAATRSGNSWSLVEVPLGVGANMLRVRAVDTEGNETVLQRSVTLLTPLTVTVSGSGSVTKEFRGTTLQVPGATVAIQAKADPGYYFSGWTGSVSGSQSTISFVVEPGMTLTANFLQLPFASLRGRYSGLLKSSEGTPIGTVQIALSESGSFTAKFNLNARKVRLKGTFDASGRAAGSVDQKGSVPVAYDLSIDLENGTGTVSGTVTKGGTDYPLETDRVVSKTGAPSRYAGIYTARLRPTRSEAEGRPTIDGWASLKIQPSGKVRLSGQLGDGTPFSTTSVVSENGKIPIFLELPRNRTSVAGVLQFEPADAASAVRLSAALNWTKGATGEGPFSAGFETQLEVLGFRYNPFATPLLQVPAVRDNLELTLSGGGLPSDVTFLLTLTSEGEVISPPGGGVKIEFNSSKGTFTGTVELAGQRVPLVLRGVLLQGDLNAGSGVFEVADTLGTATLTGASTSFQK